MDRDESHLALGIAAYMVLLICMALLGALLAGCGGVGSVRLAQLPQCCHYDAGGVCNTTAAVCVPWPQAQCCQVAANGQCTWSSVAGCPPIGTVTCCKYGPQGCVWGSAVGCG